ncbi:Bacterial type II secretion system protein F domain protein [Roseimaritima multifibrata]|uniref:Bacterial type II secretion system protein F domain protein n=1 Tax=Roseimaritima multifibrata TaxID=1930274 RepID=A0A517MA07_9BACT|nr:type II secretion system F family protein [Roseimaritima multifibrata]QDS91719.1 Bacterial type II secretion system protein F domain protein [Roseimaritima multifibrata]
MAIFLFTLFGLMLAGGLAAVAIAMSRSQQATTARRRLFEQVKRVDDATAAEDIQEFSVRHRRSPVLMRYWWIGIPVALLIVGLVWFLLSIPWPYLLAFFVMILLCAGQIDAIFVQMRVQKLEQQLADSIDMMVAAVKSGAGLQSALESSVKQARRPWLTEAEQLTQAVRYGDDPVDALGDLSERLPLESVLLFSQTLAVNWRVGGRLALTLANVGRTVRDRIELSRRMNAMTTQARLSVVSVIVVTYFIGALIWRNDPERMTGFLTSMVGQIMVSVGMMLQAVGTVWISWISKPRF